MARIDKIVVVDVVVVLSVVTLCAVLTLYTPSDLKILLCLMADDFTLSNARRFYSV